MNSKFIFTVLIVDLAFEKPNNNLPLVIRAAWGLTISLVVLAYRGKRAIFNESKLLFSISYLS